VSAEAGRVFISYVREDAERAGQLKDRLEAAGIPVWLDKDDLWPGEDWRAKIRQAIEKDALVFIACFSRHSVARARSYQYEELTLALEQLRVRRPGDPWLIPVRFDECDIPDLDIGAGRRLGHLHCADLFGARLEGNASRLITAVLRILGRDAFAAPFSVSGRRHVAGSLARSLADGTATRAQVLGFFGRQRQEVGRFWQGITDRVRDDMLALLLEGLDEKAADVLCEHWETITEDTVRYLSRLLDDGEAEAAAWCLSVLGTASYEDAEDHLLSCLLRPRDGSTDHYSARISALVSLLRQRLVPRSGTFRYSCEVIRSGGYASWQPTFVRFLLSGETESALRIPRATDWVDWLRSTESAERGKHPEWLTALTSICYRQFSRQSEEYIKSLIRSDYDWTVVILRLARYAGCLPVIIEASCPVLVSAADRIMSLSSPDSKDQPTALLAELDIGSRNYQMRPEAIATIDVIRVMLGDRPTGFPAGQAQDFIARYVDALGDAFRTGTLKTVQRHIQLQFLAHACHGNTLSVSATYLLRAWSQDPAMAPGVADYLKTMPKDKFLASTFLDADFWQALAADDLGLESYVAAPLLAAAVSKAVRSPRDVLRRTITDSGVTSTALAFAMYEASRSGLSVAEILAILNAQNGSSQLPPNMLDDILREYQSLLHRAASADGEAGRATAIKDSEQVLFEFYQHIIDGALGGEYGHRFGQFLDERLASEIRTRAEMVRMYRPRRRPSFRNKVQKEEE
jgi:hypothetical protein